MVERRVTAVLLAGGDAKRFGKDKAFHVWQGKTFLGRVGEAVRGVADGVLILVAPGSDAVRYARLVPGATIVPDRVAKAGPVEALKGALVLVRTPTVLVAPCDAPGLPHALARRLVAVAEETGKPAVAAPASGPLYTLFAISKDLLEARLGSAKRLEDVVKGFETVATDAQLLNVNEPRDLAKA